MRHRAQDSASQRVLAPCIFLGKSFPLYPILHLFIMSLLISVLHFRNENNRGEVNCTLKDKDWRKYEHHSKESS